jgi:RimJ/RimL family protein N-acetyltransferase
VPATPLELETGRLRLRMWRTEDRGPFAEMNGDQRVMRHFPDVLDRDASDALVDRIEASFAEHGIGLWAVEVVAGPPFIGFVGLSHVAFEAPVRGRWEIGWRVAADQWGRGYATEAAREVLRAAFEDVDLPEVVSFTVPANVASLAVMARIGLARRPDLDFEHPGVPVGGALRAHVVHGITAKGWRRAQDRSWP